MIAVLKSKGVPVLWVGLPAVRGTKATADMLFLDSLYREAAGKAGITYVDVWDGFVDEAGRYLQQGPDFEGQIRRLRSYDGVYFTQAGARKLAHYVEREITRLLAARSAPIALPTEPATPDANAKPGQPAPRPLAGPILPLVASSSAPINCSAVRDRARPRSTRSRREPWSRASRWRRPPAAPMILSGRAARSDANRPRARHRWLPFHRMEQRRLPLRSHRRSRKSRVRFKPARRRSATSSDLELRRASLNRRSRWRRGRSVPRATSDARHRFRTSSRANAFRIRGVEVIPTSPMGGGRIT